MSKESNSVQEQLDLKQNIISESWKIIIKEGWQALSIRKIAEGIGYSVPVIYKHFENKEAILAHFSKEGYAILAEKIEQSISGITPGAMRLRAIRDSYWAFASEHTAHYRIMFGLGIPACEAINSNTEMRATSDLIYAAITDLLIENQHTTDEAYLKLKTFWSILHGFIAIELLAKNSITHPPAATINDAIEGFIYTLIHKK